MRCARLRWGLFEPVCADFAAVDGREALGVMRKTSDD